MKTYIVTGYYGSGKTEFCVNFAKQIRKDSDEKIAIADLDIINPYFRSREKADELQELDIEIVGNSLGNNTGQDIPAVSFGFLNQVSGTLIMDLAGSESGLRVLAPAKGKIENYELLCVLNLFRPETNTKQKMLEFIKSVNETSKFPVTGIINNSHLLRETTAEHILISQDIIAEVSKETKLPFKYTQIKSDIFCEISDRILSENVLVFEELSMREKWQ